MYIIIIDVVVVVIIVVSSVVVVVIIIITQYMHSRVSFTRYSSLALWLRTDEFSG